MGDRAVNHRVSSSNREEESKNGGGAGSGLGDEALASGGKSGFADAEKGTS